MVTLYWMMIPVVTLVVFTSVVAQPDFVQNKEVEQFNMKKYKNDSTQWQLPEFAAINKKPVGPLTTSAGHRVAVEDTQTINSGLLFNNFFMESITQLVRERVVERLVHAKGFGVYGYFKVTHDFTDTCKAKVFEAVGKTTPVFTRFSAANQRSGGVDTARDMHGFATRFYTEEGNLDLLALNVEVFGIKDPAVYPGFVRIFHKNPKTAVTDYNMMWDFLSLRPETYNMMMRILGDRGIPDGYRHMPGYTIHTFELQNKHSKRTFARFQLLPDAGIKNLTSKQARLIQGHDTDYATRDLYNAIYKGNYPSWTLYAQTIPMQDVENAGFDIFDVTKSWPLKKFPLRPIGTLVLKKVPDNHFDSSELVAMNPANLVPGIKGVDTLFEARMFAYRSAQNYRLGSNYNKIEINCPLSRVNTYNRDGKPPTLNNEGPNPNYFPNTFNGPLPYDTFTPERLLVHTDPNPNNYDQASEIYVNEMTEPERCRLVENIVSTLASVDKFIQNRAVKIFSLIHSDLAGRIEYGLNLPMKACDDMYHMQEPLSNARPMFNVLRNVGAKLDS